MKKQTKLKGPHSRIANERHEEESQYAAKSAVSNYAISRSNERQTIQINNPISIYHVYFTQ